nr:MAG TPA: hypothetical protein [Caudoviricetes sp.]
MNNYMITYRKNGQRKVFSRRIAEENVEEAIARLRRIVEVGGDKMVVKDIRFLGSDLQELANKNSIDQQLAIAKDRLDRFHQYQKSMAESSYTTPFVSRHTRDTTSIALHNQAYQRHRLINRQPGKGGRI